MRSDYKKKAQEGLRRLAGLLTKVKTMVEEDASCPHILENLLAMQGHIKHIQGKVLESHLHTCAEKKMKKQKDFDGFITELVRGIGLSTRS